MVTTRGFAYLIDFGLARTAGEAGLTTAGATLGTLAYMAPERLGSGEADFRSDVYALACALYECLTGTRSYPADSLEQQIAGHIDSPSPGPSERNPKLAAFDEVIAKGMAKKPEQRYQSAGELAAAAAQALRAPVRRTGGSGRHAMPTPGRVRRRRARCRRSPPWFRRTSARAGDWWSALTYPMAQINSPTLTVTSSASTSIS